MALDASLKALLGSLVVEGGDLCELLVKDLLALEHLPFAEAGPVWQRVSRHLHTLKGSGAMLERFGLAELAHALETLVARLAGSGAQLSREAANPLFVGVDYVVRLLAEIEAGQEERLAEIQLFIVGTLGISQAAAGAVAPPVARPDPAHEPIPEAATGWRIDSRQVSDLSREVDRLRDLRLHLEERRREVDRALASLELREGSSTAAARLMLDSLRRSLSSDGEDVEEVTNSLEDGLKRISSLPLQMLLTPLQRAVREVSAHLGKDARLTMIGGELAIDRHVLDALRGPLLHLVRNAVDHGLERPHVRERRRKDRTGALVIRAEQQGNLLFLELADDGGGLDLARIRQVAAERAVVAPAALEAMKDAALAQLIFLPSFSTRSEVTETSGRGVGMDVVASEVRALKGHAEVFSVAGQGTRVTLTLPIGHGSSPLVLVSCAGQHFGIPSAGVETMLLARPSLVQAKDGRFTLAYRDEQIPLDDLGSVLGLRPALHPAAAAPLLVVQAQRGRHAYLVDEILGERELVIRPLPHELARLPFYQGAVTLWRGDLAPVLRPEWLAAADTTPAASSAAPRVLVVDDAITTRAVQRAILEAGGYLVSVASNGEQALAALENATFRAVISDIVMAPMDGFELTQALRLRASTRELPVILVSARDSAEDRQRGFAAGADAFLAKKDCASVQLLAALTSLLERKG